jgi:hypothetical protein
MWLMAVGPHPPPHAFLGGLASYCFAPRPAARKIITSHGNGGSHGGPSSHGPLCLAGGGGGLTTAFFYSGVPARAR